MAVSETLADKPPSEALPYREVKPIFHSRWLVSARYDLSFFIFSGIFTFAFLGAYLWLREQSWAPSGTSILLTYFVFTTFFDLPHIFQTFARTHADKTEFNRRKNLYTWGIPLIMACGLIIPLLGLEAYFIAFMAIYGSYHIVRQHVGFLHIYQGLHGERNPFDRTLDRIALETALFACIVHDYIATARGQFTETVEVYGPLKTVFPMIPPFIGSLISFAAIIALLVFTFRQFQLMAQGQPLALPKLLLMGMALTTHYVIFVVAAVPFLVAEAIETAYHDMQYHGFMANYQRRRFPHIRHVALKWLGFSLLYGLLAGIIETIGYTNPLFYWIFAPLGMLTLFHYYIDGKIWKFSECPELRETLMPSHKKEL